MKRLLFILMLCLIIGAAEATTVTVGSSSFNTYTDVTVTADTLTNGLAGYEATLSVANGSLAEIQSITFPAWADLTSTTAMPSGNVTIQGADTHSLVEAGATGTVIATVNLHSLDDGSTTLGVSFASMDDDLGGAIAPTSSNGTITVAMIQGLHFSAPGAVPTVIPTTVGQYYDDIAAGNLSWAWSIGPIVPEPLVDIFGGGEFAWRLVWFFVFAVLFVIMFGRQKNVMIPMLVAWVAMFFMIERFPQSEQWMVVAACYASAMGVIAYWVISKR